MKKNEKKIKENNTELKKDKKNLRNKNKSKEDCIYTSTPIIYPNSMFLLSFLNLLFAFFCVPFQTERKMPPLPDSTTIYFYFILISDILFI